MLGARRQGTGQKLFFQALLNAAACILSSSVIVIVLIKVVMSKNLLKLFGVMQPVLSRFPDSFRTTIYSRF